MPILEDGAFDVALLPAQMRTMTYETEWAGVRGGKGSGKTVGLAFWMLRRLEMFPRASHYVVGADFGQLRRGFFETYRAVLERIGWRDGVEFKYRESPTPMIIHRSGARLKSLSAEQALKINSVEFQTLLLEEPQTWDRGYEVYGVLETRRRHSLRSAKEYGLRMPLQARMSFNPPRIGTWLHKLVTETWPTFSYPCDQVSVRDNYLLLDREGYIRRIQGAFPPNAWPTEIDGEWSTASGGAIREFRSAAHCNPPEGIPRGIDPNVPLTWSLDFNVGHMRSGVAQPFVQHRFEIGVTVAPGRPPEPQYGLPVPGWQRLIIRFVDEIALDDVGSRQVALEFIARHGEHARRTGGVWICGDSTGGARSGTVDVSSHWQTIKDELTRARVPYHDIIATNPRVVDSVTDLDAQFCNGDGYGITIDAEISKELIADLEIVGWNADGSNLDKRGDPRRSHSLDYARYLNAALRKQAAAYEAEPARRRAIPYLAR